MAESEESWRLRVRRATCTTRCWRSSSPPSPRPTGCAASRSARAGGRCSGAPSSSPRSPAPPTRSTTTTTARSTKSHGWGVTREDARNDALLAASAKAGGGLTHLDVSGCAEISQGAVIQVLKANPQLRRLAMDEGRGLGLHLHSYTFQLNLSRF